MRGSRLEMKCLGLQFLKIGLVFGFGFGEDFAHTNENSLTVFIPSLS